MRLEYRYASVGLAALAVLSGGQWVRARHMLPDLAWLLGVLPNFAAAVAIPFVAAAAWAETRREPPGRSGRRWLVAGAALGLIGWEVVQLAATRLVFDWSDIAATLAGAALAAILFEGVATRR